MITSLKAHLFRLEFVKIFLIVCTATVLYTGCGSSGDPEDITKKFFSLAQSHKDMEAVKLLSKDLQDDLNKKKQEGSYESAVAALIDAITENRASLEVVEATEWQGEATIECRLKLNDEKKTTKEKRLKLVDQEDEGGWRVTNQ